MKEERLRVIIESVEKICETQITSLDEDLVENGVITSVAFVEIIIEIENRLNIEIPDEKMNMLRMNSINKMYKSIFGEDNEIKHSSDN